MNTIKDAVKTAVEGAALAFDDMSKPVESYILIWTDCDGPQTNPGGVPMNSVADIDGADLYALKELSDNLSYQLAAVQKRYVEITTARIRSEQS